VNTTVGPDGALYVVDFYRKLVEHPAWIAHADDEGIYTHAGVLQESDFLEGNDRGRIYRIVPDDFKYADTPKVNLLSADTKTLAGYLVHPNLWWRINAQRLLVDRKDSLAVPTLKKLWSDSPSPEGKIHILWTLEGLQGLSDTLVLHGLSDENPVVRKQSVILAERRLKDPANLLQPKLLSMAKDPDVQVQFQLVLALGGIKEPSSFDSLANIIKQHIGDPWFQTAALLSASENSLAWYQRIRSFEIQDKDAQSDFLQRITSITGARQRFAEMSDLVTMVSSDKDSAFQLAALKGLEQGLQQGRTQLKISAKGQKDLLTLITTAPHEVSAVALEVAGRISIPPSPARKRALDHALKVVLKAEAPADLRAHQVSVLALDRGPLRKKLFSQLLQTQQPVSVQRSAVNVLLGRRDTVSMGILLREWNLFTPELRQVVESSFGNSLPHLNFLMSALEKGQMEAGALSRTTRLRLTQHTNKNIQRRAEVLFVDLLDEKREDVVTTFYDATTLPGDPLKGKTIFANRCSTCHQLGDVGRHFGPDLLSLTNQTRINLLTMIVNPNNNISPGYDGYILETTDGRTFAGIVANEKAEAIVLRTPDGKEQTIRRRQIRSIKPLSSSLMPDGLEAGLSTQDMADLIEYLKQP
jgi:putative heme-binding domain-containing protein